MEGVLERERELLREKARLLASGALREYYTEYVSMRVRPTVKQLYRALPPEAKRAAREAFEAAVLAFWLGGAAQVQAPGAPHGGTVVVNVNLNIAEARVDARLGRLLDRLSEILGLIENLARFPSALNARQIAAKAREARRLIEEARRVN